MKYLVALMAVMLTACASTNDSSKSSESAPEGSPEAMINALMGGAPKPRMDPAEIEKQPFGSEKNPVRVGGPRGEHVYLSRLRCEDGKHPTFERQGSFGVGPWGYILDGYSVDCDGKQVTVFMDMYHSTHQEDRAVPGFTIDTPAPN